MKRTVVIGCLGAMATVCLGAGVATAVAKPTTLFTAVPASSTPVLSPRRLPDMMARTYDEQGVRNAVRTAAGQVNPDLVSLQINDEAGPIVRVSNDAERIPASSMKIVTASAALSILGSDATFSTSVKTDAPQGKGTLEGDLYLVGGGDPLLTTASYKSQAGPAAAIGTSIEALADQIVGRGIRQINGAVRGYDSAFDYLRQISTWNPAYVAQGEVGAISGLLVNQGFTLLNGGRFASANPTLDAAAILSQALQSRGVSIAGAPSTGDAPTDATTLGTITSVPVVNLVDQMLTFSDNTTAEMLLKAMGRKANGAGTTQAGLDAVRQYLSEIDPSATSFVGVDGSGLDRGNRLSCSLLTAVLTASSTEEAVKAGLPKAGQTGTLRDRMTNTVAVGRIQAKTGSLADVSALVGWAGPQGSDPLTFCAISNGVSTEAARASQDTLAVALAGLPAGPNSQMFAPQP